VPKQACMNERKSFWPPVSQKVMFGDVCLLLQVSLIISLTFNFENSSSKDNFLGDLLYGFGLIFFLVSG